MTWPQVAQQTLVAFATLAACARAQSYEILRTDCNAQLTIMPDSPFEMQGELRPMKQLFEKLREMVEERGAAACPAAWSADEYNMLFSPLHGFVNAMDALAVNSVVESQCAQFLGDLNFAFAESTGIEDIGVLSGDMLGDTDPLADQEACTHRGFLRFLPATCSVESVAAGNGCAFQLPLSELVGSADLNLQVAIDQCPGSIIPYFSLRIGGSGATNFYAPCSTEADCPGPGQACIDLAAPLEWEETDDGPEQHAGDFWDNLVSDIVETIVFFGDTDDFDAARLQAMRDAAADADFGSQLWTMLRAYYDSSGLTLQAGQVLPLCLPVGEPPVPDTTGLDLAAGDAGAVVYWNRTDTLTGEISPEIDDDDFNLDLCGTNDGDWFASPCPIASPSEEGAPASFELSDTTYQCGENGAWAPTGAEGEHVKCVSAGWAAAANWLSAEVFTIRTENSSTAPQCAVTTILNVGMLNEWDAAGAGVFAENLKNGPPLTPTDMEDHWFSMSCDGSGYIRLADNAYGALSLPNLMQIFDSFAAILRGVVLADGESQGETMTDTQVESNFFPWSLSFWLNILTQWDGLTPPAGTPTHITGGAEWMMTEMTKDASACEIDPSSVEPECQANCEGTWQTYGEYASADECTMETCSGDCDDAPCRLETSDCVVQGGFPTMTMPDSCTLAGYHCDGCAMNYDLSWIFNSEVLSVDIGFEKCAHNPIGLAATYFKCMDAGEGGLCDYGSDWCDASTPCTDPLFECMPLSDPADDTMDDDIPLLSDEFVAANLYHEDADPISYLMGFEYEALSGTVQISIGGSDNTGTRLETDSFDEIGSSDTPQTVLRLSKLTVPSTSSWDGSAQTWQTWLADRSTGNLNDVSGSLGPSWAVSTPDPPGMYQFAKWVSDAHDYGDGYEFGTGYPDDNEEPFGIDGNEETVDDSLRTQSCDDVAAETMYVAVIAAGPDSPGYNAPSEMGMWDGSWSSDEVITWLSTQIQVNGAAITPTWFVSSSPSCCEWPSHRAYLVVFSAQPQATNGTAAPPCMMPGNVLVPAGNAKLDAVNFIKSVFNDPPFSAVPVGLGYCMPTEDLLEDIEADLAVGDDEDSTTSSAAEDGQIVLSDPTPGEECPDNGLCGVSVTFPSLTAATLLVAGTGDAPAALVTLDPPYDAAACATDGGITCPAGMGPNADSTACEACAAGEFSTTGVCQVCAAPNIVSSDGDACFSCEAGSGPNANSTACEACAAGQYSSVGVCQVCAAPNEVNAEQTGCALDLGTASPLPPPPPVEVTVTVSTEVTGAVSQESFVAAVQAQLTAAANESNVTVVVTDYTMTTTSSFTMPADSFSYDNATTVLALEGSIAAAYGLDTTAVSIIQPSSGTGRRMRRQLQGINSGTPPPPPQELVYTVTAHEDISATTAVALPVSTVAGALSSAGVTVAESDLTVSEPITTTVVEYDIVVIVAAGEAADPTAAASALGQSMTDAANDDAGLVSALEEQGVTGVAVTASANNAVLVVGVGPVVAAPDVDTAIPVAEEDDDTALYVIGVLGGVVLVVGIILGVGHMKSKATANERHKVRSDNENYTETAVSNEMNQMQATNNPVPIGSNQNGGSSAWSVKSDPQSGREYYVNSQTRQTTWDRPPELNNVTQPATFRQKQDPTSGRTYYINAATRQTVWQLPAGAVLSG